MPVNENAGQPASQPTSSTSPRWSPRTTPSTRTRPSPRSGSRSARRATAAPRSGVVQRRPHRRHHARRSASTGRAQGIDGPLFLGRDTHALSEPAFGHRARGVRRQRRARCWSTPRTATRRRRRCRTRSWPTTAAGPARLADGDRGHALAQPARGRRLQVQPAQRRPGRHRRSPRGSRTGPTSCCAAGSRSVRRIPYDAGRGPRRPLRLPRRLRRRPGRAWSTWTRSAPPACGSAPTRWAGPASPTGARSPTGYGLDLTVVNPMVDPTFRFMTLDWDGKIRMDCSSPYAMASLIDRTGRVRRSPPATTPTPTGTASSPRTPG